MDETPRTDSDVAPPDGIACPHCTAPNSALSNFCEECRAPLTAFSATGPFEREVSWGWGVGEAIGRRRPSTLVLLGLWLILVVPIGQFLVLWGFGGSDRDWAFFTFSAALWFVLPALGLYLATKHWLRGLGEPNDPPPDDDADLHPSQVLEP